MTAKLLNYSTPGLTVTSPMPLPLLPLPAPPYSFFIGSGTLLWALRLAFAWGGAKQKQASWLVGLLFAASGVVYPIAYCGFFFSLP